MRDWIGKVISLGLLSAAVLMAQTVSAQVGAEWVARYNGPVDSGDKAQAIAADSSGNVYVTGVSAASGTGDDYATIMYDASGSEVWAAVARYNGPDNGNDNAVAIAVDGSGDVYVTGKSEAENPPNFDDWAETSGSGTYDEGTHPPLLDDQGTVTDSWTITFTGQTTFDCVGWVSGDVGSGSTGSDFSPDNGGNPYFTISSAGWGGTWATDDTITFTTSALSLLPDYVTVKYDGSDGSQIWVARYNGPSSSTDVPHAIAIDSSDDVYVTGESYGSASGYDYATVKYDGSNGNQVWVARHNGPGNGIDRAYAIAVDGGSVYVTGGSFDSSNSWDYGTIRYDASTGSEVWAAVARYDGPASNSDSAYAIDVDSSGDVYVTGRSLGSGSSWDYATVKYNASDGSEAWTAAARYDGPGNFYDYAYDIVVDGGSVYVTGESQGSGTGWDYATVKYDATSGGQSWVARYNSVGSNTDQARAIAVDSSGDVYVTGGSQGVVSGADYATVKYNATTGSQEWLARYNGPANGYEFAHGIALDGSDNVYVTGESLSLPTYYDYATVKYVEGLTFPTAECLLEPDQTDVSKGGTLEFYVTVTNHTASAKTVYFATKITKGAATYPPSGWLYGPISFPLGAYQSKAGPLSQYIPLTAETGTYTYHGYVGVPGPVIYHECTFDFSVTP